MKIMVTGGAGFIGSWLCETLAANGHSVIGYDSLIGGDLSNLTKCPAANSIWFHEADILNRKTLTEAMKGCDAVYHCAALAYEGLSVFSPGLIVENIVVGSVNVMVAAVNAGVKRVINCSSMARYGNNPTPYYETMRPKPMDPYGLAKLDAELQMTLLGSVHNVHVVHAVPHNVIGPRQKYDDPFRNAASIMINRILQGKPPIVYGDGSQKRCFSFIGDVLPTLIALLDAETYNGEIFNVGPDEESISVLQLAETIIGLMKAPKDIKFMPPRPCENIQSICSSNKIRKRFGYKTMTKLVDGLQMMIDSITTTGPKPFVYHLPLEIESELTPKTWKDQLI